jgi:transposase
MEELEMRRHEISDEQWKVIEPLLPGKAGAPGRTAHDNRLFVYAVFWIARIGVPWRDLPNRFGPWNSAYQRFNRWSKRGVWGRVLKALGGDAELSNLLLGSTIVRAHQHAAGAKGGKTPRHWDVRVAVSLARSTSLSMTRASQPNCT